MKFYSISCTAKNCDQMLRADAATTVCSRLMDPDPTGQLLFRSVDILWNMLENGDQGQLAEQLNNLSCIRYCTAFICVGLVPWVRLGLHYLLLVYIHSISWNFSDDLILAFLARLFSSLKLSIANKTSRLDKMWFRI